MLAMAIVASGDIRADWHLKPTMPFIGFGFLCMTTAAINKGLLFGMGNLFDAGMTIGAIHSLMNRNGQRAIVGGNTFMLGGLMADYTIVISGSLRERRSGESQRGDYGDDNHRQAGSRKEHFRHSDQMVVIRFHSRLFIKLGQMPLNKPSPYLGQKRGRNLKEKLKNGKR